jgi:transposase
MARVEILTGLERRRSWSDEEKLAILSEVAAGEGTVAEIARRHDILAPQIYAWRRKFSRTAEPDDPPTAPVFLPVTVVPAIAPEVTHGREAAGKNKASQRLSMNVEIRCKGGRVLKVDAGLDPSVLQALVRAVEDA